MPIYEYRCEACGHEMDHFHRSRSEPKPACGSCGEDRLERLVSLSAFHLKGSGWYATDYKSDKKQTNDRSVEGSAGGSKGSTEGTAGETAGTDASESAAASSSGEGAKSEKNTGSSKGGAGAAGSTQSKDAA